MTRISDPHNYSIAFCKKIDDKPGQTLFRIEHIVRSFETNTGQNLFQNLNVSNQTRKTKSIADKLIRLTEIGRPAHIQVDSSCFKPLQTTQSILPEKPSITSLTAKPASLNSQIPSNTSRHVKPPTSRMN
jgi:hypothetical protein